MTIGKSSKQNKAPHSPPFLDRASGFYGRLEERDTDLWKEEETRKKESAMKTTVGEKSSAEQVTDEQEHGIFDFNQGMMEDDGATLLQRKPNRLSRRWSRKSSKRSKAEQNSSEMESQSKRPETEACFVAQKLAVQSESKAEVGSASRAPEPVLVNFSITAEADDQALITQKDKPSQMDERMRGGEMDEHMIVKRSAFRNYRKALDRALRRGWETFVANLYSVTLTPVSSTSPTTSTMNRNAILAEYR